MDSALRKLRVKFVCVIMAVVAVVLAASFAAIVALNYNAAVTEVYEALDDAIVHAGSQQREDFPAYAPPEKGAKGQGEIQGGKREDLAPKGFEIGGKAPGKSLMPTAVYVVDGSGQLSLASSTATGAMTEEVLADASAQVSALPDGRGFIDAIGVFYSKQWHDGTTYVAFADEGSVSEWKSLALALSGVGAATLVVFFLISLLFSKWALRPVAESWRRQQQFVADASHELKTPLTVMAADVSILKRHPTRTVAAQSQWVESMETEIESMQDLVGDMLLLASSDAAAAETQGEAAPVDFSKLVSLQLLQFESLAYERGVSVASDVGPNVMVSGNAEKLRRLVGTLLDNAIKYAGEGGRIEVELLRDGGNARLLVNNSGDPIPAEDLPHVFDRFYRVDKSRGRDAGRSYGLGLAIASDVAKSHGGSLSATSSEASGTTFVATLPVLA